MNGQQTLVEVVGWMLVHSLWLLIAPAIVLAVVLLLVPQKFSAARCNMAMGTLLMMAALPFCAFQWVDRIAKDAVTPGSASTSESLSVDVDHRSLSFPGIPAGDATDKMRTGDDMEIAHAEAALPPTLSDDDRLTPTLIDGNESFTEDTDVSAESLVATFPVGTSAAPEPPTWTDRLRPFLPWTVAAWIFGTLLMSLRLLLGWRTSRKLRCHGGQPVSHAVQRTFDELRERIGANRATRVVLSTLVSVPSVLGHFKPVVLLPMSAVTGLSEGQLRAILAHELGHVRRWDFAINILQTAVETVLFYHPAVWWVSGVVRDEREHCCDDIALRAGSPPAELARALVTVDAVADRSPRLAFENVLATASDGGHLLRRVRRIANVRRDDGASRRSWLAGCLVLMMLAATLLTVWPRATVADDERSTSDGNAVAVVRDESAEKADDTRSNAKPTSNEQSATAESEKQEITQRSAPQDVPLPKKDWLKPFPPSGSGLRVQIDDQRWVEFIALAADVDTAGEQQKIVWRADGELIDPPPNFDPLTLVPDRVEGRTPRVSREVLGQLVGPKGIQFSLNTSGSCGWGQFPVAIDDDFEQIPINTIMSDLPGNHAYVEVKVTRPRWEQLPVESGDDYQVILDPEAPRLYVLIPNANDYAWELGFQRDAEEPKTVAPSLKGGTMKQTSMVSDAVKAKVQQRFRSAQYVAFFFEKDKPLPDLTGLRRSRYDVVRFDNLSVFPGPRSAVRVSINGKPVSGHRQPELSTPSKESVPEAVQTDQKPSAADHNADEVAALTESILLAGKVVNSSDEPVANCWVGMFVEPAFDDEGKSSATVFDRGPALSHHAITDADGSFSILAKKTRSVFDGSFWAVAPDGASGVKRLHAVWSYTQKNLTIKIDDAAGAVRVVDENDQPLEDATVVLEAIRQRRGVTQRLPVDVQIRQTRTTNADGKVTFGGWPSAGIRGIAVTTKDHGTQFLDSMRASSWVTGDEALMLKLQPTASMKGRVEGFDPKKHSELKLQVTTEQHEGKPPLSGRAVVAPDDNGNFAVDTIVAGRVSFESSLLPDSTTKVRFPRVPALTPGEDRSLEENPELVPAVTVRQQIIRSDTGEGIPDMKLRVLWGDAVKGDGSWRSSKPTTTDADGWWTAHVLPGTINVRIRSVPKGYEGTAWFDGRSGYLGVEANVPATDQTVTLPPEEYVPSKQMKGRLQYADGSPAANWMAYGHPISWDDVGVGGVHTDKDGHFRWGYPEGYPPRLFKVSNRQWTTDHGFEDRYVIPKVISTDPFVLEIPEKPTTAGAGSKD